MDLKYNIFKKNISQILCFWFCYKAGKKGTKAKEEFNAREAPAITHFDGVSISAYEKRAHPLFIFGYAVLTRNKFTRTNKNSCEDSVKVLSEFTE